MQDCVKAVTVDFPPPLGTRVLHFVKSAAAGRGGEFNSLIVLKRSSAEPARSAYSDMLLQPSWQSQHCYRFLVHSCIAEPLVALDEVALEVFGLDSPVHIKSKETLRKALLEFDTTQGQWEVCSDTRVRSLLAQADVVGRNTSKVTLLSKAAIISLLQLRGARAGMVSALHAINVREAFASHPGPALAEVVKVQFPADRANILHRRGQQLRKRKAAASLQRVGKPGPVQKKRAVSRVGCGQLAGVPIPAHSSLTQRDGGGAQHTQSGLRHQGSSDDESSQDQGDSSSEGADQEEGDGRWQVEGRLSLCGGRGQVHAHRLLCWLTQGLPPFEGMVCSHLCGLPNCLCPFHLSWVWPITNCRMRAWHEQPGKRGSVFELTPASAPEEFSPSYGPSRSAEHVLNRGRKRGRPRKAE